jgi:hypothetical protein
VDSRGAVLATVGRRAVSDIGGEVTGGGPNQSQR